MALLPKKNGDARGRAGRGHPECPGPISIAWGERESNRAFFPKRKSTKTGIVHPFLCFSAVVGFGVFGPAGDGVQRPPGVPVFPVFLALLFLRQFLKGNLLFHAAPSFFLFPHGSRKREKEQGEKGSFVL